MAQSSKGITAATGGLVELADIFREHIRDYQDKFPLRGDQYKVVSDILNCRTAYLGGRIEKCDRCGSERITYNSCRNRHCPKCQNIPRERWIKARKSELLPVNYFHTVFTLPHDLNPIILCNKKTMLNILFKSVSETLLSFGLDKKRGLGGKLGFIAVLHTWDQQLRPHYHLHCLVPGGVMGKDGKRWKPCKNDYLFNEEAMSIVYRGKFVENMTRAYQKGDLSFPGIIAPYARADRYAELKDRLYSHKWVVHVQKPIKNPLYVVEYLGRYTHRVAISNQRILSLEDGMVTFAYKNRETGETDHSTIDAVEFIRRFLLHVLPKGFVKIRQFGFLANRSKAENLDRIRACISPLIDMREDIDQTLEEMMQTLTGIDMTICSDCKEGRMRLLSRIPAYVGLGARLVLRRSAPIKAAA